jgi:hypothetical protein
VQRRLLIFSHEAAVPVDVGAEYGREFALHYPPLITVEAIIQRQCNFVKLNFSCSSPL